jgi:hypothetical protein
MTEASLSMRAFMALHAIPSHHDTQLLMTLCLIPMETEAKPASPGEDPSEEIAVVLTGGVSNDIQFFIE